MFNFENESHALLEMARVGKFDVYTVNIHGGEGRHPHFHFINKEKKIEGCIRLDIPEYFKHDGKDDILSSKERKQLIKWLNSNHSGYLKLGVELSIYKYMCILWNDNNPDYIYNDLEMPDYTKLPAKD